MEIIIPPVAFLAAAYGAAGLLVVITVLLFRNSFFIQGVFSWILLLVLAGVPALPAVTLAAICQIPIDIGSPSAGLAFLLGTLWMHYVLPAALPEFQSDSFGSSALTGLWSGVGVLLAGFAIPEMFNAGVLYYA